MMDAVRISVVQLWRNKDAGECYYGRWADT